MSNLTTLRDIIAEYAPDQHLEDKIQKKYILEIDRYITEESEMFGCTYSRDIYDDYSRYAFDTEEEAREFLENELADIRETAADHRKSCGKNEKIHWSFSARYAEIDCIIADENPNFSSNLDLFGASLSKDSSSGAYYDCDLFIGSDTTDISYDSYYNADIDDYIDSEDDD